MPVVQQTRALTRPDLYPNATVTWWDYGKPDYVMNTRSWGITPGSQTTQSFRTGKSAGDRDYDLLSGKDLRKEILYEGARSSDYDRGNPFWTTKETWDWIPGTLDARTAESGLGKGHWRYDGGLFPSTGSVTWPSAPSALSESEQRWYGSRLIKAATPTAPSASLAVLLGELREAFPKLVGSYLFDLKRHGHNTSDIARAAGSEYLNYQFGILPTIKDTRDIVENVLNSKRILEDYRSQAGRFSRRSRGMPEERSSSVQSVSNAPVYMQLTDAGQSYISTLFPSGYTVPLQAVTTTSRRVWFSGSFQYYLEKVDDLLSKFVYWEQQANHLLGTRFDAGTLWELAPWSWLIDWCMNVGTVLTNASAFSSDNLVLKYGYLMCHQTVTTVVHPGSLTDASGRRSVPHTLIHAYERKERVRSTPYGFALSPDSFTSKQWAILGALALTKAPTSTW